MNIQKALSILEGVAFHVMGPFLVADLQNREDLYALLEVEQHGMENVGEGKTTKPHKHGFVSMYKAKGLNVVWNDREITLPEKCLTIVPPDVEHPWVPKRQLGSVGSLDARHAKQVMQTVAVTPESSSVVTRREGVFVVRIPAFFFRLLSIIPGWRSTPLGKGRRIQQHLHSFLAIYFTEGVPRLQLADSDVLLPHHAMVLVWPRTRHGWATDENTSAAVVGHFHPGHAAHAIGV